jgi:hypothetical protein
MASYETISVYYEGYEQGHRRDRFRIYKEPHMNKSAWKSIILAFGKTFELENGG